MDGINTVGDDVGDMISNGELSIDIGNIDELTDDFMKIVENVTVDISHAVRPVTRYEKVVYLLP